MMTRTLLARCAPIAIAASAALPAFPAAAQDVVTAEPVIVLPEPAAPIAVTTTSAPAPTIVLPRTVAPEPVGAAEDEPPAPVAAERVARTTAARSPTRAAAAQSATTATPIAETETASPAMAAPLLSEATAAPSEVPVAAPVQAARSGDSDEIALAALLGALGLAAVGGIAFAATRRRRRGSAYVAHDSVPYAPVAESEAASREPAPTATFDSAPAGVFTSRPAMAADFAAPVAAATSSREKSPARASGDPVALPQDVPETFEERDALLKELVAAEPDRANPFTGVRARARRAKLIIQSLGQDFRDRKPRIDLSQYTNRWPALRGWQPATA